MQHNRPISAPYMRVLSNPSPALAQDQGQGLQRDHSNSLSGADAMSVTSGTSLVNKDAIYPQPAEAHHQRQQYQHPGYPLLASDVHTRAPMTSQGQSRQQTFASIPTREVTFSSSSSSSSSSPTSAQPSSAKPNGAIMDGAFNHARESWSQGRSISFPLGHAQHLPHPHAPQQQQHQHQRVGFIRNISKASVSSVASQDSVDSLASYLNYESVAPPSFPMGMGMPMGHAPAGMTPGSMSGPSMGQTPFFPLQPLPLSYAHPQHQQQTLQQHFAASSSSSASLSSSQPSVHSVAAPQHRLKSKSRTSGGHDDRSDERDDEDHENGVLDRQSVTPPALTPLLRFDSGSQQELGSTPPPQHDASMSVSYLEDRRERERSSGTASTVKAQKHASSGMPLARHLPPAGQAGARMMTMPVSSAAVYSRASTAVAGVANGDAGAMPLSASAPPSVRHSLLVGADGEDAWSALNGSRIKRESKSSSSADPIAHRERKSQDSDELMDVPLPSSSDIASPFKAQNPRLSQPTVEPASAFARLSEAPVAVGAFTGIGALTPPSLEPSQTTTVDEGELYTDEEEYSFDEDEGEEEEDRFERFSDEEGDRDADTTANTTVGSTSTKANDSFASVEDVPWKTRVQAQKCQNKNITGEGGVSGTRVTDDGKLVKTRRRTRPQEAMILLEAFRKDQFPTGEEREKLALKLGLAPK